MKKLTYGFLISSILFAGCAQSTTQAPAVQPPAPEQTSSQTQAMATEQESASLMVTQPASTMQTTEQTTQAATGSQLAIGGLTFTLPKDWVLQSIDTEKNDMGSWPVAKIQVPDPQYHVVLPMQVVKSEYQLDAGDELLTTTPSGAKIYNSGCDAIACYFVVYNGTNYQINVGHPDSDQPVPENLDGVWFPDTTVTSQDVLNFVSTIK